MRKPARQVMIRVTVIVGAALGAALSPAAAGGQGPEIIRFDGGAYDRAGAITIDGAGNSYLGGAVDEGGSGSSFAVVKLGPDGTVRWSARYDGSRGGVGGLARAVAVDAAGDVYAAGLVHDGVIFNQSYDYLVAKFAPDAPSGGPSVTTARATARTRDPGGRRWQRRRVRDGVFLPARL